MAFKLWQFNFGPFFSNFDDVTPYQKVKKWKKKFFFSKPSKSNNDDYLSLVAAKKPLTYKNTMLHAKKKIYDHKTWIFTT